MSWQTHPLSEIADFVLGKMLDQAKNRGEPRPYLANVNVRWGDFDLSDLREMRFEPHEVERYGLKTGDIVMCEGGEPGRCALWRGQREGMMIQKALHRIRPHAGVDSTFLYYAFLNIGKQNGFAPFFTGATIKHLPREQLARVPIRFPEWSEQKAIAVVLSAYDDLIATNQRRIALLGDTARRLYREWFVHLRFPGHESVLVEDGVPEGWRQTPIVEQTSFLNRGIAPKYDDAAKGRVINQKCVRGGRISMEPARRQSKDVKPDRLVRMGDVLINSTGAGTLGRVAQVRTPIEDCTVDTHVTIARPIDERSWTYFGQTLLDLEPVFSGMGKGATNQLELSRSDIGAVEIWQPPQHLHVEFDRLVGPMLVQAEQLSIANLSLQKARDQLLPKLMSGQLDVSGIALPDEVAA